MVIKKLFKIISYLLIFSMNIFPCYSISVLHSETNVFKTNKKLSMLYSMGEELKEKISKYINAYDNDISSIMYKHKIGKNSVTFNEDVLGKFNDLKRLEKSIGFTNKYMRSFAEYNTTKFTEIKNKITKLLLEDEYVRKLCFLLILVEVKYDILHRCSYDELEKLKINITNLIINRMVQLLANSSIYKDFSLISQISNTYINLPKELNSTEEFSKFIEDINEKFNINSCIDIKIDMEQEINNFFAKEKNKFTPNACKSDACESDACESDACESDACKSDACESDACESDAYSMDNFLNEVSYHENFIAFLYSAMMSDGTYLQKYDINQLIDKRALKIIDTHIINTPGEKTWEGYHEENCKELKDKINDILCKDEKVAKGIIEQIQSSGNDGNKLTIDKINLDEGLLSHIYNEKLPDVFKDNQFGQFNHESTVLYPYKRINSILNKFSIRINDSNTHLGDHFKSKADIESKVLAPDNTSSYSGKFNVGYSAFANSQNIRGLMNAELDDTIMIVSTYQCEKKSKKNTNYVLYFYNYRRHGFVKTGEVYCKFDGKWYPTYAIVLVVDKDKNLVTAHPRYIS